MERPLEPAVSAPRRRLSPVLVVAMLVVWAGLTTVVAGTLMAGHWTSLPRPSSRDQTLQARLAALRPAARTARWQVVHVLYAACRCSNGVLEHLVGSPRRIDAIETVVLVIDDDDDRGDLDPAAERLADKGIQLHVATRRELAEQFHIEAAPMLIVVAPDDTIRYAGGYSRRKQDPVLRDREIISELQAAHAPVELPVFGCGVSDRLRSALDPLGLK